MSPSNDVRNLVKRLLAALFLCALMVAVPAVAQARRPAPRPTPAPVSNSSGVAMPAATLAGWGKQVMADDFTSSTINTSLWDAADYWGQPGGDPGGWWNPTHDIVSGGMLVQRGYRDNVDAVYGEPSNAYVTAGIASLVNQTYGKWEVRAKMDNGKGIAPVILLWPKSNNWPTAGEVDFAEDGGSRSRVTNYMDLHYACPGTTNDCAVQNTTAVDWSQWHTYGVEWTPGKIIYTLDGKTVGTVTSHVPTTAMHLTIQDQAEGAAICGGWASCLDSTTPAEVDFDTDWAVAWAQ